MRKVLLFSFSIFSVLYSANAQWHYKSCGVADIDSCSVEEFNCMWQTATETVNKGVTRTVLGIAGLSVAFFLTRATLVGDVGGPVNSVVVVASGVAGIICIFSGPIYWSLGSKQKSQLQTSPHYKSLSLQNLNITPAIHINHSNNSYAFGLTASLSF